jgi:hypothetical protein
VASPSETDRPPCRKKTDHPISFFSDELCSREKGENLGLKNFRERMGNENERKPVPRPFYRYAWTGQVHLNRTGPPCFLSFLSAPSNLFLFLIWRFLYVYFNYCACCLLCGHVTSRLGRWILDPTPQDALGKIHMCFVFYSSLCFFSFCPFDLDQIWSCGCDEPFSD